MLLGYKVRKEKTNFKMLLDTNEFLNKKSFALRKLKLKKSEFDEVFRIYSIYSTVGGQPVSLRMLLSIDRYMNYFLSHIFFTFLFMYLYCSLAKI